MLWSMFTVASACLTPMLYIAEHDEPKRIICSPIDPIDCYPAVFEPSREFKLMRPGQLLPDAPPCLWIDVDGEAEQLQVRIDVERDETELKDAFYTAGDPRIQWTRFSEPQFWYEGFNWEPRLSREMLSAEDTDFEYPSVKPKDNDTFTNTLDLLVEYQLPSNESVLVEYLESICDPRGSFHSWNNSRLTRYYSYRLTQNYTAVLRLLGLATSSPNQPKGYLAARLLGLAVVGANYPARELVESYHFPAKSRLYEAWWTGTANEAANRIFQLDQDDTNTSRSTLSAVIDNQSFEPLMMLLTGLQEKQNSPAWQDTLRRLAGPLYFDGIHAGSTPEWDYPREYLIQHALLPYLKKFKEQCANHEPFFSELIPEYAPPEERRTERECRMLQTWARAIDDAWKDMNRALKAIIGKEMRLLEVLEAESTLYKSVSRRHMRSVLAVARRALGRVLAEPPEKRGCWGVIEGVESEALWEWGRWHDPVPNHLACEMAVVANDKNASAQCPPVGKSS